MSDNTDDSPPPVSVPPRRAKLEKPVKARRSSSDDHIRERAREYASTSARKLARLVEYERRETLELQRIIVSLTEQLKNETDRANEAERRTRDTTMQFKSANDARLSAQQELARISEELRLYKLQLENAQQEIYKAQDVLHTVEAQRNEAEEDAARARSTARRLKEEKLMHIAREEGRRMGIREGLARGRELGFQQGHTTGYARGLAQSEQGVWADDYGTENGDYDRFEDSAPYAIHPSESPSIPDRQPYVDYPGSRVVPVPPTPQHQPGMRETHPMQVHNSAASPLHQNIDIPPDGWIPTVDADAYIRLPPPHEMARPLHSPGRPASPSLPPLPEEDETEPLMIPAPRADAMNAPGTQYPSRPKSLHRRRSSYSSQGSTTMSQYEILGPPSRRSPPAGLAVIPESMSAQASPSARSPTAIPKQLPVSMHAPSLSFSPRRSPAPPPVPPPVVFEKTPEIYYQRAHESSSSSEDPQTRSPAQPAQRKSSSTLSVPDINIQPPTRPNSKSSKSTLGKTSVNLLSPADAADRPLPDLPSSSSAPGRPPALGPMPGVSPMVVDQLPPGFVPSGPPVGTTYTAANVPLPASTVFSPQQLSSVGVPHAPTGDPSLGMPGGYAMSGQTFHSPSSQFYPGPAMSSEYSRPVIPPSSLRSRIYGGRPKDPGDNGADSSLSSSSTDSLSTPPLRANVGIYGPAHSSGDHAMGFYSHSFAAPRSPSAIPLPASTVGSVSVRGPPSTAPLASPRSFIGRALSKSTLKHRESKASIRSSGSGAHKRFEKEEYVDPAFLASSEDVTLRVPAPRP